MTQTQRSIWLIGPFPPPLHGQAVYNAAIADHLQQHGTLHILATGSGPASKVLGYGRILWTALFRIARTDIVYTSMPGQLAAWLFALVVAALRLRGIRHFVHHHSYRSIALGPMTIMRLVVWLGRHHQHHILLSPVMRERFVALYLRGKSSQACTLSNAFLFCPAASVVVPRAPRAPTIGHLSVLSAEKGVDTLIQLFRQIAAMNPVIRLILAGPVGDKRLHTLIDAASADFPDRFEYRGPVTGEAKAHFYGEIDLFVLPTRLIDEAEPLVMLESYSAGVEFMGSNRGCIRERLRRADCLLSDDVEQDSALIVARLDEAATDWSAFRQACGAHANQLHASAASEAASLFAAMLPPADHAPPRKPA